MQPIKLDDDSEKKVVRAVLKLLEDKNGEVQNLAVKCLGPLVNKVKENQVETIVDTLCTNMTSNNEQLRDISSIGLKTVISELPQTPASLIPNVCQRITGKLSNAIKVSNEDVSVQLEALDILSDLLSRFGDLLIPFHEIILHALVPQLESSRQAVRKRTIVALSHLLTTCSNEAYNQVIVHLLEGLDKPANDGTIRTYIQCLASICRQAGHRLCNHIDRVMHLLNQYSQRDDDELREFCLQAFEAFVLVKQDDAIKPHIPAIVDLCLRYITYDPNYNYEADDGDGGLSMETEEDEEVDSEEYSDDDDMSWKVRRSAAKCLESVISTRPELIEEFYRTLSPALISRFKEREENVKSDIFHAYIALLKNTRPLDDLSHDPDSMDHASGPVSLLQEQVPTIIKAVQPLMREKSAKTRQDCFLLLREMLSALPGALSNHIDQLMSGIHYSLSDKNTTSNMKIDALSFVHCMLVGHNPQVSFLTLPKFSILKSLSDQQVFHPHIQTLVPLIVNSVFDPFYKIATEALMVLQQLVKTIRPLDRQLNFNFTPYVPQLYSCTLQKLQAPETDQEVKERAIACMGQIIANMGDVLQVDLVFCLPIFMERMRNEVTRISSVKALTMIAGSPLRIKLGPILNDVIPALGSFLRKNQRALKLNSLTLLDTLVNHYSNCYEPMLLQTAILELPALLCESDLHVAQLSLVLLTSAAKKQPQAMIGAHKVILPEIMNLIRSPLLQGSALNCTLNLFQALVQANIPGLSYRDLLEMLMGPVNNPQAPLHKQVRKSNNLGCLDPE